MRWEKIAEARVMIMALLGFAALCVMGFLFGAQWGWGAIGVSLLALAYLTDPHGGEGGQGVARR